MSSYQYFRYTFAKNKVYISMATCQDFCSKIYAIVDLCSKIYAIGIFSPHTYLMGNTQPIIHAPQEATKMPVEKTP